VRIVDVARDGRAAAEAALRRPSPYENTEVEQAARAILEEVRTRGEDALLELGHRFDSPLLDRIEVTPDELRSASDAVEPALRDAVAVAAERITAFHEAQRRQSWQMESGGVLAGQIVRPLDRVGLYIPGGTAVYPSSVLMCALPARVAGVPEIVLCTPCRRDGSVHPLVLHAARVAGVQRVFRVGGAQAIAAMAFGAGPVPAVDKIAGPGNQWVNAAKRLVYGAVDIDMLAGPSEVCVLADDGARADFAAADMLVQAEHDVEAAAYLVTCSRGLAERVAAELERQMSGLPREGVLRKALDRRGALVIARDLEEAVELVNVCAPEHLALMVREPFALLGRIRNAGAVLLGDYAPQTLGDYAAGPSHTLPTSGTARYASPLHVDTFLKKSSFLYATRAGLAGLEHALVALAETEGFDAHAAAVRRRLRD